MNGPQDWGTTLGLIAATVAGAIGCVVAARRIARDGAKQTPERLWAWCFTFLTGGVFLYRALGVHEAWTPLENHVDGLALMAVILGIVVIYLQWTRRLPGIGVAAMALGALLTLWGVCASWWTLREFDMRGVWKQVHLFCVYLGTLGVTMGAASGALWLYVDRQMRSKDHRGQRLRRLGRLASLEALEAAVTRSATLGFVLLTGGLVTGLIIEPSRLGAGWWHSPKILLAGVSWGIFAVVMNVRHVATFRGRRAAVLSIVGFVLLIAVFGIAQSLSAGGPR